MDKKEEGSATDCVTDVTDVSPMSVGRRRKKQEARSKKQEENGYLSVVND
ncbi:hypothetical protein QUB05_02970 [Microcoleus sp. F10-C6]